jgi:hypothetical protein
MKAGDEFKNYKELCKELKEETRSGRSKELQLKRWQLSFKFHKEGNKIIIDEVNDKEIRAPAGGNRKHVNIFLPYVICCLYRSGITDEYIGTQRLFRSELQLIPSEMYGVFNKRSRDHTDYLRKNSISLYESLTMFVHYFEVYAKETVEGCFNVLAKDGGIKWSPGQIFIVGISHKKKVCITGYAEVLDKVEEAVCKEMNKDRTDLKGRQYLHVVKRDKKLSKFFYAECIKRLTADKELMKAVKAEYERQYDMEFIPDMLVNYFRVYHIESIDRKKLRKWKVAPRDSLRMKKAFVNSVGPEMQTLKENVYRDIFRRMSKKNKFGIPDGDFESLKYLISKNRKKLTNMNYSPKEYESQGDDSVSDIPAEN